MKPIKIFLFYLATLSIAHASPGAHGPNGEHLDGIVANGQTEARPRVDTFTESFELVGQLQGNQLSVLVDRYETNEPVLNGKLEVEFNELKAPATFRADQGDYVVNDSAFLKALAQPGKHPLVFTLATANESDLLEGTLEVRAATAVDEHTHFPWAWAGAGLLAALLLTAFAVKLRRAKSITGK